MKILLSPTEVTAIVNQAMQQALLTYAANLGIANVSDITITVGDDGSAVIETGALPAVSAPQTAQPKASMPMVGTKRQAPKEKASVPALVQPAPAPTSVPTANPTANETGEPQQNDGPVPATNVKPLFSKLKKPTEAPPAPVRDAEMEARMDAEISDMKSKAALADQIGGTNETEEEPDEPTIGEETQAALAAEAETAPPAPPARSLFANLRKPQNN